MMRTILTSALEATAAAFLMGSLVSAQKSSVPINVQPPASVDVVFFTALNAGKVMATTDAMGKGTMDVTDLLNLGKLEVIQEKCQDRDRLLMAPTGVNTPDTQNCKKRRVGSYWPGHDTALNVKLQSGGGLNTPAKAGLIAGAGVGIFAAAKAGSSDSQTTSNAGSNTGGTTITPVSFNGTYTGTMAATGNGCNFSPTVVARGVLSVDTTGKGTWQKTHTNTGVTFNFNVTLTLNGSTATFTAQTTQLVGSQNYQVTDTVSISGATLSITQMFVSMSATICTVQYTGQLTKG
jgi:hypothetical protein